MKNSKVLKTFLIISGLLLSFIGGSSLIMPVKMKATAGIELAGQISALNDARAYSALLLVFAITTFLGAFNSKLSYSSALISTLLFLSLGFGRVVSIVTDGIPADGLVKATALEFILGTVGAVMLIVFRNRQ